MTPIDVVLRLVGAFYVLGGAVLVRAILTSRVIDAAIAALSAEKTTAGSEGRAVWHLANAVLLFAGGIALMLLSDLAVWLFATSLAGQALYFVWLAPRYFDRTDPPDAQGRRQSVNAFVIYAAATALVVWAWYRGRLAPWREEPWQLVAAAGGIIALLTAYVVLAWRQPLVRPRHQAPDDDAVRTSDGDDLADAGRVTRIRVATELGAYPLWSIDPDNSGNLMPDMLPISADLVRDLEDWAADYALSRDPDDPEARPWGADRYREHADAGRRLAERLAAEMPHLEVYVPDAYPAGVATELNLVRPPGSGAS